MHIRRRRTRLPQNARECNMRAFCGTRPEPGCPGTGACGRSGPGGAGASRPSLTACSLATLLGARWHGGPREKPTMGRRGVHASVRNVGSGGHPRFGRSCASMRTRAAGRRSRLPRNDPRIRASGGKASARSMGPTTLVRRRPSGMRRRHCRGAQHHFGRSRRGRHHDHVLPSLCRYDPPGGFKRLNGVALGPAAAGAICAALSPSRL